ncbi:MAG: hypothetical protein QOH14_218, partial [Pseudonocardiales bacterium]|nr:hypothetical protein [Pseudonocardiales bacterium]
MRHPRSLDHGVVHSRLVAVAVLVASMLIGGGALAAEQPV